MTVPAPLADACPRCIPGDPDAALPLEVTREETGSLKALYRCPSCAHVWFTWWDARSCGWPATREAAA